MIQTIRKAWGIPELRKKIVFTLLILLIFRVGNAIPTPYINTELLGAYIDSTGGSLLSLYNVMSGGAFAQATVFALGVQPYINRDRKSTRLNSSHSRKSRMPSSA